VCSALRGFAIARALRQTRAMIRRALTNTGWLMGARGINALLSLGYLALATRALGLEGYGNMILVTAFAQAISGVVSFQTWQSVVRWGQRSETVADAIGFSIALDLLSVVAGSVVAGVILAFAGDWLPVPEELRGKAFALTVVWLLALRSTPTGILRLHDRYAKAAIADSVTSVVRLLGSAIAFIVSPTIPAFLLAWAAGELVTAAAYWFYALQNERLSLRAISLSKLPSAETSVWSFVWGTGLSGTLLIASRQLIVLLVGAFGGAAMAGIYRVAAQLGEGLLKLAQALLRATYPELVRDPEKARHIARRIGQIALVTGIATVAVAAVAGHWVLDIIAGREYRAAYMPMIILSAAAAVELAGASLEALLVARGHAFRNFMLRAVPTALAVAIIPFAVPLNGAIGASFAVLAASALTVAGLLWVNRER